MPKLKNITPDVLDVPYLGRYVKPGEVFDAPDAQEDGTPLHWSPDYWQAEGVDSSSEPTDDSRTVVQLQEELRSRDLPTSGTKAELVERLAKDDDDNTDTTNVGE